MVELPQMRISAQDQRIGPCQSLGSSWSREPK
jgi:hypothetical protein